MTESTESSTSESPSTPLVSVSVNDLVLNSLESPSVSDLYRQLIHSHCHSYHDNVITTASLNDNHKINHEFIQDKIVSVMTSKGSKFWKLTSNSSNDNDTLNDKSKSELVLLDYHQHQQDRTIIHARIHKDLIQTFLRRRRNKLNLISNSKLQSLVVDMEAIVDSDAVPSDKDVVLGEGKALYEPNLYQTLMNTHQQQYQLLQDQNNDNDNNLWNQRLIFIQDNIVRPIQHKHGQFWLKKETTCQWELLQPNKASHQKLIFYSIHRGFTDRTTTTTMDDKQDESQSTEKPETAPVRVPSTTENSGNVGSTDTMAPTMHTHASGDDDDKTTNTNTETTTETTVPTTAWTSLSTTSTVDATTDATCTPTPKTTSAKTTTETTITTTTTSTSLSTHATEDATCTLTPTVTDNDNDTVKEAHQDAIVQPTQTQAQTDYDELDALDLDAFGGTEVDDYMNMTFDMEAEAAVVATATQADFEAMNDPNNNSWNEFNVMNNMHEFTLASTASNANTNTVCVTPESTVSSKPFPDNPNDTQTPTTGANTTATRRKSARKPKPTKRASEASHEAQKARRTSRRASANSNGNYVYNQDDDDDESYVDPEWERAIANKTNKRKRDTANTTNTPTPTSKRGKHLPTVTPTSVMRGKHLPDSAPVHVLGSTRAATRRASASAKNSVAGATQQPRRTPSTTAPATTTTKTKAHKSKTTASTQHKKAAAKGKQLRRISSVSPDDAAAAVADRIPISKEPVTEAEMAPNRMDAVFGRGRKKDHVRNGSLYRSLIEAYWLSYSRLDTSNITRRRQYVKEKILDVILREKGRFIMRDGPDTMRLLDPNDDSDIKQIFKKVQRSLFNEKKRQEDMGTPMDVDLDVEPTPDFAFSFSEQQDGDIQSAEGEEEGSDGGPDAGTDPDVPEASSDNGTSNNNNESNYSSGSDGGLGPADAFMAVPLEDNAIPVSDGTARLRHPGAPTEATALAPVDQELFPGRATSDGTARLRHPGAPTEATALSPVDQELFPGRATASGFDDASQQVATDGAGPEVQQCRPRDVPTASEHIVDPAPGALHGILSTSTLPGTDDSEGVEAVPLSWSNAGSDERGPISLLGDLGTIAQSSSRVSTETSSACSQDEDWSGLIDSNEPCHTNHPQFEHQRVHVSM